MESVLCSLSYKAYLVNQELWARCFRTNLTTVEGVPEVLTGPYKTEPPEVSTVPRRVVSGIYHITGRVTIDPEKLKVVGE